MDMDEWETFPPEGDGISDDYCVLHEKRPLVLPRTKITPPFIANEVAVQAAISTGSIMADTQYATVGGQMTQTSTWSLVAEYTRVAYGFI